MVNPQEASEKRGIPSFESKLSLLVRYFSEITLKAGSLKTQ
jgi:hypothetical protein